MLTTDETVFKRLSAYFYILGHHIRETEVKDQRGRKLLLYEGVNWVRTEARKAHDAGNKIMFLGNGGSAAIASHMATDYSKNGGLRSVAFNDAATLTCLGNDLGYENVFAKQVHMHARPGDLLVAISSSGNSPNILLGTAMGRERDCRIVTFSGFGEDNGLRSIGDVNFYVRSREYGFVEIAHLTLCHAILDIDMGWSPD